MREMNNKKIKNKKIEINSKINYKINFISNYFLILLAFLCLTGAVFSESKAMISIYAEKQILSENEITNVHIILSNNTQTEIPNTKIKVEAKNNVVFFKDEMETKFTGFETGILFPGKSVEFILKTKPTAKNGFGMIVVDYTSDEIFSNTAMLEITINSNNINTNLSITKKSDKKFEALISIDNKSGKKIQSVEVSAIPSTGILDKTGRISINEIRDGSTINEKILLEAEPNVLGNKKVLLKYWYYIDGNRFDFEKELQINVGNELNPILVLAGIIIIIIAVYFYTTKKEKIEEPKPKAEAEKKIK
jgi:hypothetical protein